MNKVQEYWLPHNGDTLKNARPGQFVYKNSSSCIAGFIARVDGQGFVICLFDAVTPKALPVNSFAITDEQSTNWVAKQLEVALIKNPDIREHWVAAVKS